VGVGSKLVVGGDGGERRSGRDSFTCSGGSTRWTAANELLSCTRQHIVNLFGGQSSPGYVQRLCHAVDLKFIEVYVRFSAYTESLTRELRRRLYAIALETRRS